MADRGKDKDTKPVFDADLAEDKDSDEELDESTELEGDELDDQPEGDEVEGDEPEGDEEESDDEESDEEDKIFGDASRRDQIPTDIISRKRQ